MQFKYNQLLFIPACIFSFMTAPGQNVPDLTQTAPSGTATNIPQLPEAVTGTTVNSVKTYIPWVPLQTASFIDNAPANEVQAVFEFRDGFNRTFQRVQRDNARVGTALKDRVQIIDTRIDLDHYNFLPYAANNTAAGLRTGAVQEQKAYYQSAYPGEGYTSAGKQIYYSDANIRQVEHSAAGKSQVGENRYTVTDKQFNAAGEVRSWKLNSQGLPVTTTAYAARQLFGVRKLNEASGGLSYTYTDKDGRLIMKEEVDSGNIDASPMVVTYACTYYVYDELGRLRYTLTPKAVDAAKNAGWSVSTAVLNNLCFQYQYDDRGRLAAFRKPGEAGFTHIVYDRKNRPVMRQTPAEADSAQWEVSFYDGQDREIATSVYYYDKTPAALQDVFDGYSGSSYATNNIFYYLVTDAGEGVYPAENAISRNVMMTYSYYDDYRMADPDGDYYSDLAGTLNFTEFLSSPGAETPLRSFSTQGLVTGSKIRILPAPGVDSATTGQWKTNTVWYDHKGRPVFTVSYDLYHERPVHAHYIGTQYDFANRVLISKHIVINKNVAAGDIRHTELTKNVYEDATGRLVETDHQVDGGMWNVLAHYTYDDLGRLQREGLGSNGEVRDYTYNIRGQLAGINAHYAETGDKQGQKRTFGESLKYDYGFTQPRYDGKLAGMIWRGSGAANEQPKAYGYHYDLLDRLTAADFSRYETSGPVGAGWSNYMADRSMSNVSYDKNGNLLTMVQRAEQAVQTPPNGFGVTIDSLVYTYGANSNQVTGIWDGIDHDYGVGDFQDLNEGTDYRYDGNGNITADNNKKIGSITYTTFNKPQTVSFKNGDFIKYSYDATGQKVQEQINNDGKGKTDYIGNFVYVDDRLQYIGTPQGRTVWVLDTVKEEFFAKDHLGNVRSVVDVYAYPIQVYLASYEIASAHLENLFFDNIDSIRVDKPASTDPDDTKAGLLNGSDPNKRIGTALLMKVMAGDQVEMNVNTYYDGYDPNNDKQVGSADMLSNIISTLTGGVGGLGGSESHNPGLVNSLFTSTNYTTINNIITNNTDIHRPKAYLNYVLFDQGMHVVSTFTGAFQAQGSGTWTEIGTTQPLVIPQNGFLAVYESNQSASTVICTCNDVYFDQLVVHFTRANLKEEEHYYPFGLPMGDLSSTASDFTPNRRRYQTNEYIQDAGLNWMDFHARQYDPQVGRFMSVDPMAADGMQDQYSPYTGMIDQPQAVLDPGGLYPLFPWLDNGPNNQWVLDLVVISANGNKNISPDPAWKYGFGQGATLPGWLPGSHGGSGGGNGGSAGPGPGSFGTTTPAQGTMQNLVNNQNPNTTTHSQNETNQSNEEDENGYNSNFHGKTGEQNSKTQIDKISTYADLAAKGTIIPKAGLDFVANTETGKLLSSGWEQATAEELEATMKLAKPLARGIEVVNVVATAAAVTNDFTNGRYKSGSARVVVWGIAGAATFIPVAGWAISAGIGIADAIWGDEFYNYVETHW